MHVKLRTFSTLSLNITKDSPLIKNWIYQRITGNLNLAFHQQCHLRRRVQCGNENSFQQQILVLKLLKPLRLPSCKNIMNSSMRISLSLTNSEYLLETIRKISQNTELFIVTTDLRFCGEIPSYCFTRFLDFLQALHRAFVFSEVVFFF